MKIGKGADIEDVHLVYLPGSMSGGVVDDDRDNDRVLDWKMCL
jgi:hypothetical protein